MSNHVAAGNPTEMIPHMRAIEAFLKQRGGLRYLGMDGVLADNFVFADHTRVVNYNNRPSYSLHLPSLQPEQKGLIFSRSLGRGFLTLWENR